MSIEASAARLHREVIHLLRPGLSYDEIQSQVGHRPLDLTDELAILYGWRNGTDVSRGLPLDDLHLVPGFYLLSLEDAIADYDSFTESPRWSPAWLPLLANGGGDFLLLDTSRGADAGAVRHFRIEEREHPIEYDSLSAMAATFAAAYERNLFYIDSQGYLEMDENAYTELAAELNPTVAWWLA